MARHTPGVHDVAQAVSKLTHRDHVLIGLIGDHGVFTTDQIHRMFFTSLKRTQARLLVLHRLDILERFRTRLSRGSEQWHWVLDHLGARLHAAANAGPAPRPATVADTILRLSSHPALPHTLGVNDFFVRIRNACRARSGCELTEWNNESAAAAATGMRIRPDASAVYTENDRQVSFWFEHDRGTETLTTLTTKADRYRETILLGQPRPVLFELPTAARETHLHEHLTGRHLPYPLATTHTDIAADPTGPVWRVVHRDHRHRLIDIATTAT